MISILKRACLAGVLAMPLLTPSVHANVYATGLRLNGFRPLTTTAALDTINITYVLNEPATLGVTVNILSGPELVRTLTAAPGANGTLRGTNLIVWDGNDTNGLPVPCGSYEVRVIPSATGYTNWTQINSDSDQGSYVFAPRGVAVNVNSNSPFYGRIFVGNAGTGPDPEDFPGDNVTILKINADGTFASEGPDGDGGYADLIDLGSFTVPEKLRVADDERLYMMDLNSRPVLVAFDMLLTTNEVVLSTDNYIDNMFWVPSLDGAPTGWFSMDVTSAGTSNALIWLGQWEAQGAGVWNWHVVDGVADPNDNSGNWAVAVGGSLSVAASGGLMVDDANDIFVSQYLTDSGDTNADCLVFTNWNGGRAFNGQPVTNGAAWSAGGLDDTFLGLYDTSIDSRQNPKYVACALNGGPTTAGIRILNAATGATVVSNLDAANQYYATAWDNVGNLYGVSGTSHLLRVFSPPAGANQSLTAASLKIVSAITSITRNGSNLTIDFATSSTDTAGEFTLQEGPTLDGVFTNVPGSTVIQLSPGRFSVGATFGPGVAFFRISQAISH